MIHNNIKIFNDRNTMINHYLKNNDIGCELGVFIGNFSNILLNKNPNKLYLVDLFNGIQESGDKDGNNIIKVDLEQAKTNLINFYKNDARVNIVQSSTVDFLNSKPDNYFNYVYIDADHSYEAVKNDLKLSYKKIKNGGFILGHDYITPRFDGVVRAVNEFCQETNLYIEALTKCGCPSFCIAVNK